MYQGLGYCLTRAKIKLAVNQATSTIKKVTKIEKRKISIPTPPKGITSRHDYKL